MVTNSKSVSRTTSLTGAAVFGALAALITFLVQIPYPVPFFSAFLNLDLAEIVDVSAFLIFGPTVGLLTAFIHYLVLHALPQPSPVFGPLLKLFGVTTMLIGMWLGHGTYSRILKRTGGRATGFAIMVAVGAAVRAILLTPVNYLFLLYIFAPNTPESPSFLNFYLGGIAVYTVVLTILATGVSFIVVGALSRAAPNLEPRTWFAKLKSQQGLQTENPR